MVIMIIMFIFIFISMGISMDIFIMATCFSASFSACGAPSTRFIIGAAESFKVFEHHHHGHLFFLPLAPWAFQRLTLGAALQLNSADLVPESYMIGDAARAAHIPGIGTFGSGFLSVRRGKPCSFFGQA